MRNERNLYHRKSAASGKQIISMYSEDKDYPVYEQEEWWGDTWDGRDFGQEIDFSRSFFDQIAALRTRVPQNALYTKSVENGHYTNFTLNLKDCYLVFGGGRAEDCQYSRFLHECCDVLDAFSVFDCERCYEIIASQKCYECLYAMHCRNCSNCLMVEDCTGCRNCLLCVGLSNKEYYILNEKVSREEYEKRLSELMPLTRETIKALQEKLEELRTGHPHPAGHIYGSEECTGDMIFDSKGCSSCFDIKNCEGCEYLACAPNSHNTRHSTYGAPDGMRWSYECCSSCGTDNSMGCFLCWHCSNTFYSIECSGCQHLFGCIGLKNQKYCILNKQYTKDEYERVVPQVIEHMQKPGSGTGPGPEKSSDPSPDPSPKTEFGEFFPMTFSPFGYNETVACDYFPMTQEEVEAKGWYWFAEEKTEEKYMGPSDPLPESIEEVDDTICDRILTCEETGKHYKINKKELEFYRSMGLPIPTLCPVERHMRRHRRKTPYQLWERGCEKCGKEVTTSYSPYRPECVVCEQCYFNSVY